MRFTTVIPAAALVASVTAKTVRVDVGKGGLVFVPASIQADKGDTLEFHFATIGHSVAAGDKSNACNPATSAGFFSGVLSGSAVFQVTVDSTDTQYIYCTVPGHCQSGMVGVINGAASDLTAYKAAAESASNESSPSNVTGGTVLTGGVTSSTSSAAGSSSSGSASATSSGSSAASSSSSGASKTTSAASTSGASQTTSAASSGASSSASSTASATTKPNGAMGVKGSVAGVLAAAGGVAAMML